MANADEDRSLAADMMDVERLLGHNVVRMIKDNLVLDLLLTYSSDLNRVQRVVKELREIYHQDDFALFMDEEDDDVLLNVPSPFLNKAGPDSNVLSALSSPVASDGSSGSPPLFNDAMSSTSESSVSQMSVKEPLLLPAKLSVPDVFEKVDTKKRPGTSNPVVPGSSMDKSVPGTFNKHRNVERGRASEDSHTSSDEGSEPEIISILDEDRKRKKRRGSRSPGKKTRVEVVDLVPSSPNNSFISNEYFNILQAMFPDADPSYLRQKFKHIEDEQELNHVAIRMLEMNDYPRIVAGGPHGLESEGPCTSSQLDSSIVVIKPSVLNVQDTDKVGPIAFKEQNVLSDTLSRNVQTEEADGVKETLILSPSDSMTLVSANEIIDSSETLPKSLATESIRPDSTAVTASLRLIKVSQLSLPSTSTQGGSKGSVSSTATTAGNESDLSHTTSLDSFRAIENHLEPQPSSLPHPETSDLLSNTSTSMKVTPSLQSEGKEIPGASGTNVASTSGISNGENKEDPWAAKLALLKCILPNANLKFLEENAKILYNKDEEFKLFVETALEPDYFNAGGLIVNRAIPINPPILKPKPMNTASSSTVTHGPGTSGSNVESFGNSIISESSSTKLPGASGLNISALTVSNTPGSSAIPPLSDPNIAGPSAPKPSGPIGSNFSAPSAPKPPGPIGSNMSAPSVLNIAGPSGSNIPRANKSNITAPIGLNIAGPSSSNIARPSSSNIAGPSGSNIPGPSGLNTPGPSGADAPGSSGANNDVEISPWAEKYSTLLSILPEADPTYLEEKAKSLHDKEEDFKLFVANALENKDYPTLKDYQRRQETIALQNKYLKNFNIENFLEIVPEPFKFFTQSTRKPSLDTQNRGLLFLKRKYRLIRSNDITAIYKKNVYNLTNTCHELNQFQGMPLKSRRADHQIGDKLPDANMSLQFLQEVAFIENETKIKKYLKDKEEEEEQALKEAREKGELLECNCCFDDEVLARNIVTCPEGHIFCKSCVRKGAETKIGEGSIKFSCLTSCQAEFSLHALQSVLKPTVFSKLVQRKQVEEIKSAGIEDLAQCPFCDFCNIPSAGDKIFRCLNPDCMKDSCIMCKEESHIPLRCNEVEKATEVKMRTYIEDKMTEALVRTCWKCQKKFVKIDGCNKMTCQCGALMCYICRQPVKDYSHFNGQGGEEYHKCPLFSDNNAVHAEAVERVAAEAKAELSQKHPGLVLRHDPTSVPVPREASSRIPGFPFHHVPGRVPVERPVVVMAHAARPVYAPHPVHAPHPAYAQPHPAHAQPHPAHAQPHPAHAQPHPAYAQPQAPPPAPFPPVVPVVQRLQMPHGYPQVNVPNRHFRQPPANPWPQAPPMPAHGHRHHRNRHRDRHDGRGDWQAFADNLLTGIENRIRNDRRGEGFHLPHAPPDYADAPQVDRRHPGLVPPVNVPGQEGNAYYAYDVPWHRRHAQHHPN